MRKVFKKEASGLDKIEKMANEIIFENVEIVTRVLGNDEITSVFYRAKLDLKENVRVVFIGDYDSCACCAPHVKRTGEVGLVKILDAEKLRGGMRLHITAGRRAMCVFDSLYKTALRTSELISTPKDELYSGVENLLNNFNSTRNEYERFRIESFTEKASKIERTDKNAVMYFEGASSAELREVANSVMERVSGFLVLLGGYDGALSYVLTNTSLDVKDVIRDINTALNGRGGGRGTMATGTFSAAREDVFRYFDVKKAP